MGRYSQVGKDAVYGVVVAEVAGMVVDEPEVAADGGDAAVRGGVGYGVPVHVQADKRADGG